MVLGTTPLLCSRIRAVRVVKHHHHTSVGQLEAHRLQGGQRDSLRSLLLLPHLALLDHRQLPFRRHQTRSGCGSLCLSRVGLHHSRVFLHLVLHHLLPTHRTSCGLRSGLEDLLRSCFARSLTHRRPLRRCEHGGAAFGTHRSHARHHLATLSTQPRRNALASTTHSHLHSREP